MSKVLLDENLPHALRNHLPNHDVVTAVYAGLAGYKNGALLRAADEAGFDVLVTADKTLPFDRICPVRKWHSCRYRPMRGAS